MLATLAAPVAAAHLAGLGGAELGVGVRVRVMGWRSHRGAALYISPYLPISPYSSPYLPVGAELLAAVEQRFDALCRKLTERRAAAAAAAAAASDDGAEL